MTMGRLLGTWLLLAVAMTANGIFRELVLRPRLGTLAGYVSVALGAVIIVGVTWAMFRAFRRHTTGAMVQAGLLLIGMTVAFETAVGRWVDHKSWSELAANYAFWRGALWPFLLLLVGLTPLIWGRWAVPGGRRAR